MGIVHKQHFSHTHNNEQNFNFHHIVLLLMSFAVWICFDHERRP